MLALIDAGDFKGLFIEHLGWSRPKNYHLVVLIDDVNYDIQPIAQYHGIRVWSCNSVPDRRTQRLIDGVLRKEGTERLVIFHDSTHQEWKWPMSGDEHGRGQGRLVTHEHYIGKRTEGLLQRLSQIRIGIDESPSVVEIVARLRKAFDADKVTSVFYARFLKEAEALAKAIRGLSVTADREWYAALLMNRLMFIYFMQRKGFMDSRLDYLADRLRIIQSAKGRDRFFEFYTDFLIPLFHDGLGSAERPLADADMAAVIGDVPYINGGIFSVHPLEIEHTISIPDRAFESIFELFDAYQWHLDDRPTGNPTEINPDVLGYIFEQFINNKEQGAYYTKDDVTYFMTSSSLVPSFLDKFASRTGINPWAYVTGNPGKYVWDGLRYGAEEDFPDHVAKEAGSWPRPAWGRIADESTGFPGETWWEVAARRAALESVNVRLAAGEVNSVNDAVTANIDLEALAMDVIDGLDNPDDVASAWETLSSIKVIDPTCGSGAFLFAALKILEALYSAVLDAADRHAVTSPHAGVRDLIDRAADHPSRAYFVLKHATLSNLYGVDIMREAVEIARLRLFLKLVSAVATRDRLEPLPDLDFNIKVGNILVGAHTIEAIERASDDLYSGQTADEVVQAAGRIADEYREFQSASESGDIKAISAHKERLNEVLTSTRDVVDAQYFTATGGRAGALAKWQKTHQPFHWFIEFPEVFANDGFDVVVGNPPYVARTKIKGYTYRGFETDDLPDIYAPCVERASQIVNQTGRFAMILPISAQFSADFTTLRAVFERRFETIWVSTFSRNPAALFSAGLGVRSTILIGSVEGRRELHVTKTHRWYDEYRPALFEVLNYIEVPTTVSSAVGSWPRTLTTGTISMSQRMLEASPHRLSASVRRSGSHQVGLKSIALYWLSCYDKEPPSFTLEGKAIPHTAVKGITFGDARTRDAALAVLASKVCLYWWACHGDDFNVTSGVLTSLPVDLAVLDKATVDGLAAVGREISKTLPKHVQYTKYAGKWMGNYVLPEMRGLTDKADAMLARALGYEALLPDLELFYWSFYKPTGDRPGTLRESPFPAKKKHK